MSATGDHELAHEGGAPHGAPTPAVRWNIPVGVPARVTSSADEESRRACRLMAAVREQERRRLRDDLHDSVGPALAGVRLRLDTAASRLHRDPRVRRLVVDAASEAAYAIEELRRVLGNLSCPPDLDEDDGLGGALLRLVERMRDTETGVRLTARVPAHPLRLPLATEIAAYRIAAEGVTNALRHAAAREVTVRLSEVDDNLVVDVEDDGVGIHSEDRPCHQGRRTGEDRRKGEERTKGEERRNDDRRDREERRKGEDRTNTENLPAAGDRNDADGPEAVRGRGAGYPGQGTGLASMRRRAEAVGGFCVVIPGAVAPGGTLVRAVLPRGEG